MSQTPITKTVDLTLTLSATAVTEAGFGTPLILTDEGTYGDGLLVHTYSSLTEVAEDWDSATEAHKLATAIFAQSPTVEELKIGVSDTYVAQIQTIVFSGDIITGNSISITVDGTVITQAFDTDHLTTMTALAAQIAALSGVSTAVVGGSGNRTITVTAQTAGVPVDIEDALVTGGASQATVVITTTTANYGPTDDLDAIIDEDNDWYFLLYSTDASNADVPLISTIVDYVQTINKIFVTSSNDANVLDSGDTTDAAYYIQNANTYRSKFFYSGDTDHRADGALVGMFAPKDPGAAHAHLKELSGLTADDLTSTQRNAIEGKEAFYFENHGGVDVTHESTRTDGYYMDTVRDIDYAQNQIETRLLSFMISKDKIPYTNAGVSLVIAQLKAALQSLVNDGVLASFDEPEAPLVEDVSASNKTARFLPDITFVATYSNAIYKIEINGTLTL